MMCDRRYCGCVLRGANLMRLAAVGLAAVALAGATALQDLLDGILIALSVLTAGLLAIFMLQVHMSRRRAVRAVRPARAAVVAAPRRGPAVPAQPRQAPDGSQRVLPDRESPGQAVVGAIQVQL
jgi:hypothetical protein